MLSFRVFSLRVFWHLKQAFVIPLDNRARVLLLLVNAAGVFFAAVQAMVLNYGVVAEGLLVALLFHVLRFLLLGFVGYPLTFWLLSFSNGKWWVALVQALSACLFLFGMEYYLFNALGFALLTGPFWAISLRSYAGLQSRENHSRETVLLVYINTLAGALGYFAGGFFLEAGAYVESMLLCGMGLVLVTFLMTPRVRPEGVWGLVRKFIGQFLSRENPYRRAVALINIRWPTTQLTFLCAVVATLSDLGLPTWMGLVGISPVSAGFSLGMRPILGLVLTPVVGSLVGRSSVRVGQLGAGFMVLGWLVLVAVLKWPYLLLLALTLLAVGTNMVSPAELGWWMKKRSDAGILARELLMNAGRVPTIALMLPFLFILAPSTFPFIGLVGSGLFFLGARHINKTISFRNALGWRASNRNRSQQ